MAASFFESFTPREVARISAAGTRVRLPEGWSPVWESTPADKAYIILSGEVSVRRGGAEIAHLGAGDIMGETAIVNNTLRTATLVALTPLELIHLTDDAVRRLCEQLPSFEEALAQVVLARREIAHTDG
jgi:CRP/FNR family transcriptional regulator, cyclic AMP receptor protein